MNMYMWHHLFVCKRNSQSHPPPQKKKKKEGQIEKLTIVSKKKKMFLSDLKKILKYNFLSIMKNDKKKSKGECHITRKFLKRFLPEFIFDLGNLCETMSRTALGLDGSI